MVYGRGMKDYKMTINHQLSTTYYQLQGGERYKKWGIKEASVKCKQAVAQIIKPKYKSILKY